MFKVKTKDRRDCGHISERDKVGNMYTILGWTWRQRFGTLLQR